MTVAILACLLVLLALGLAERRERDRAWREVPIRIHVNGSRGKSTVTRLIWSALREAGIPSLGKTTGTSARLLLPDGAERPIVRRAAPSIREQLVALRQARRAGARAAVIECMALDPELQWMAEREMLRATVGVITNVRRDHTEIMGNELETIAATLANTIPRSAALVVGDDRFLPLFRARAEPLQTSVFPSAGASDFLSTRLMARGVAPREGADVPPGIVSSWLAEDMAVALTVTRHLHIADEIAIRGFLAAPPDPGAARSGTLHSDGRMLHWLDTTAANDPDSLTSLLAAEYHGAVLPAAPHLVIYNHRVDRAARIACFARHSPTIAQAARVVVTGSRPPWSAWRALRRARGGAPTEFVSYGMLAALVRHQPSGAHLVFCGNTRGFDLPRLLREVGSDG